MDEVAVKDEWANLPDVALLEIYKCLSDHERVATALVCKNWKRLFETPLLWRQRCVSVGGFNAMDSAERAWRYVQQFGKHLRTLTIRFHGPTYRTVKSISLATEFFLKKLATTPGIQIKEFTLFHANMERNWHFVASKNRVVSALCRFLRRCRNLEVLNLIAARMSLIDGCRILEALGRGVAARKLKIFYMEDMFQTDVTPVSITRYREAIVKLIALEYIYTNYNTMCGSILRMFAKQKKMDKLTLTIDNDVNNCLIPPEEWTNFKYNCPSTKVIFYLYAAGFRHTIHHALPETIPMYEVDIIAWPAIVENRMESLQRLCGLIHHIGNVYSDTLGSFSLHLDKHMPVDDEILYFLSRCQRVRDLSLFCRMSVNTVEKICQMQQHHHINLRSLNLGVLGLNESELRYLLFIRKQLVQAINQRNPNVIITTQAISSEEEEEDTEDETEESENEDDIHGGGNAVIGNNVDQVNDEAENVDVQGVNIENGGERANGDDANVDNNPEVGNENEDNQQAIINEVGNNEDVEDENGEGNDGNEDVIVPQVDNNNENNERPDNQENENEAGNNNDAHVDANVNNENVEVENDENQEDTENNGDREENNDDDENDITDDEGGVFAALMFDSNDESDEEFQPEFMDINEADNDYPDDSESDETDEDVEVEADDEATDDDDENSSVEVNSETEDDPESYIPKKRIKLEETGSDFHGNVRSCTEEQVGRTKSVSPQNVELLQGTSTPGVVSGEQTNSGQLPLVASTGCGGYIETMIPNTSVEIRYLTEASPTTGLSQHLTAYHGGNCTRFASNVSEDNSRSSATNVTVNDLLGSWEYEDFEPTEWDCVLGGGCQPTELQHHEFYIAPSHRVDTSGQHDNARMSLSDSYSGNQFTFESLHDSESCPVGNRLDRRFIVSVQDGSDSSSEVFNEEGQFSTESLAEIQDLNSTVNTVTLYESVDNSSNSTPDTINTGTAGSHTNEIIEPNGSTPLELTVRSVCCENKQAATISNTPLSTEFCVFPVHDSGSISDTFYTTDSSTDVLSHLSSADDLFL